MPKIICPDKPDWEPLQKVVGARFEQYMFMGMVPLGAIRIYLYKHNMTRRYLNLDGRGGAYSCNNGTYQPISIVDAITYAQS